MKLQSQTYYDRMLASLGDKRAMLSYLIKDIPHPTVLDVGGGDGSLLKKIQEAHPHMDVFNLDAAEASVSRSVANGIPTRLGYSDEIHKHFSGLDNILASSVVHEIFSYGNDNGSPGKISSVESFLDSAFTALAPGGRLIIRDGVHPEPELTQNAQMRMTKNQGHVQKFLEASPFTQEELDRKIQIEDKGNGVFTGSLSSLMEFAFTYTWGEESFEREVEEFYGVFTLSELSETAQQRGFTLIHAEKYLQPGYVENLPEIGFFPFFPDSNALWVFEKPL